MTSLLLASVPAMAQIYSCTVNGKTDFQDRPCNASDARQSVVASDGSESLVGCYDTDLSTKTVQKVNRLKIARVPGKGYVMTNRNLSDNVKVFLKPASQQEMKALSQSIFAEVTHGLRVADAGKPYGLYRAVDKQGKEVYYYYWRDDHANPFGKKVACI